MKNTEILHIQRVKLLPLLAMLGKKLSDPLNFGVKEYSSECNNRYENGYLVSDIFATVRVIDGVMRSVMRTHAILKPLCIRSEAQLNRCIGTFMSDDEYIIMLTINANTDRIMISIGIKHDPMEPEEYFNMTIDKGMLGMYGELVTVEKPKQYITSPIKDDIYQM